MSQPATVTPSPSAMGDSWRGSTGTASRSTCPPTGAGGPRRSGTRVGNDEVSISVVARRHAPPTATAGEPRSDASLRGTPDHAVRPLRRRRLDGGPGGAVRLARRRPDAGISDVGNGYTQVTVEVAGTTVTVATDDTDAAQADPRVGRGRRARARRTWRAAGRDVTEDGDRKRPSVHGVCLSRRGGRHLLPRVRRRPRRRRGRRDRGLVAAAPVIGRRTASPRGAGSG